MIDPNDNKTTELTVLPPKAETEAAAMQQMQQVVKTYGDNLPYSYDRVLNECAFFIEASAKAAIELGKRLILLKEMEGHGNFIKALNTLGLSNGTAHNVMKVAAKLSNFQTSGNLLDNIKSRSKVFELMILDDGELKELSEGGTVAGLKLDDVDRMSVRELRIALREARETVKSKDGLLSNKNKKLDEMEGKLETMRRKLAEKERIKALEAPEPDREANALRQQATNTANELEITGIRSQMRAALQALDVHKEKSGLDHTPFMLGLLAQIEYAITDIRSEFNLYGDPTSEPGAFWETEAAQQAAEANLANLDWDKLEGKLHG